MKKIELFAGTNLDKAIDLLKMEAEKAGEPCFGEFNGKEIYSTDTVDEAYMKVLGKTKAEFEEGQRKRREEYERAEREAIRYKQQAYNRSWLEVASAIDKIKEMKE